MGIDSCILSLVGQISDDIYSYLAQIMYCGYENAEDFAEEITARIDQIIDLEKKMNGVHYKGATGNGADEL